MSRKHLTKPMTTKLLDVSRNYWKSHGVSDWGIVIEEGGRHMNKADMRKGMLLKGKVGAEEKIYRVLDLKEKVLVLDYVKRLCRYGKHMRNYLIVWKRGRNQGRSNRHNRCHGGGEQKNSISEI